MDESPLVFPKRPDRERLEKYKEFDTIYKGEHYEAFNIRTGGDMAKAYKKLRYVCANFAGLMSRVLADMLFGEPLTIDLENPKTQQYISDVVHENDFINQLYESAILNSRRGDDVFKIRIGKRNPLDPQAKSEIIIEQVGAPIYFPQFDNKAGRNVTTQDIIATTFLSDGKVHLHKETHQPGSIFHEVFLYDDRTNMIIATEDPSKYGYPDFEDTRIRQSLVFHIPNFRDGAFYGPSDYRDLLSLFFAINNRLTKTDNILDKHSDPILAVPPGVIDEQGKVKKEALGMFEVDNENPGFNKPEYIVWNANLDSGFKEIDKIIDLLFMLGEIAPATMGMDKEGQTESGRALKFKLLSTIRKRNRKISYYDMAIKRMLKVSQELSLAWGVPSLAGNKPGDIEVPSLKWGDGIINDQVEQVETAEKRIAIGISSRADEISRIDEVPIEKAKLKVKEIDAEEADVPVVENNTNGSAGNTEED